MLLPRVLNRVFTCGILEEEYEISLGDAHIATLDGEAMFFHDSIDFSTYAGTDLGFTPYYLEFIDDAGLIAAAYAGAQGGGETLGSELITSWSNDYYETFSANANGHDIDSAIETGTDGRAQSSHRTDLVGKIAKIEANLTLNSGATPSFYLKLGSSSWGQIYSLSTGSVSAVKTLDYYTGNPARPEGGYIVRSFAPSDFALETSLKCYTDIPATGLHLMSTKNGTTRNMASQETGFDPNRITEIRVWRV